jgi:hypothetical protein
MESAAMTPVTDASNRAPSVRRGFPASLAIATIGGGTLDIVYAFIASALHGRMPMAVLQSVASGWQGRAAYTGGVASAALGLATHYGIMLVMAAVFGLAARRWARLLQRPMLAGLVYGLALYAVMYGIVLPLRFPDIFPRLNGWVTLTDILVHMAVGVIIAWVFAAGRAHSRSG